MAQKVVVELVDDLDGTASEGISTVTFGLDGVSYEIDLSDKNAGKLRDEFASWIGHARRSGGRRTTGRRTAGGSSSASSRRDLSAVRAWARANGHQVSDRGRVSAAVQEAYDKAH